MSDYIVSINEKKYSLKTLGNNKIELDGSIKEVELSQLSHHSYLLKINNNVYQITSEKIDNENFALAINGASYNATVRTTLEEKANEYLQKKTNESGTSIIKSPMPGLIVKIIKQVGDSVEVGDPIILLEAMKMENEIRASASGIIKLINTKENISVEKGEILLEIG